MIRIQPHLECNHQHDDSDQSLGGISIGLDIAENNTACSIILSILDQQYKQELVQDIVVSI